MKNWQSTFIELLKKGKEAEADDLKYSYMPDRLFKYRKVDRYTIESIYTNTVYLGNVRELNDPYESSYSVDPVSLMRQYLLTPLFKDHFKRYYGREMPENLAQEIVSSENVQEGFKNACSKIGIGIDSLPRIEDIFDDSICNKWREIIKTCSFSEDERSMLMWSHYSDQHRGVCIEYNFKGQPDLIRELQPVYYSDTLHDITDANPTSESDMLVMALYISSIIKSSDWSYEREWRLVGNPSYPNLWSVPVPKAVYLGIKFNLNPDNLKKSIFEIAKTNNIPIYQMRKHAQKYALVPQKI